VPFKNALYYRLVLQMIYGRILLPAGTVGDIGRSLMTRQLSLKKLDNGGISRAGT